MNVKKLAINALQCPVRTAIERAWETARKHAWYYGTTGNLVFCPDNAVVKMSTELADLVRRRILEWWEVSVDEGYHAWYLDVRFTYKLNGTSVSGSNRFKVW